jgi:hypothetical protein
MPTPDITLKRLGLSAAGKEALAELAREFMQKQARAGISADGAPLPPSVDLHQSGRLFRDVTIQPNGEIRFNAPYAATVNARYGFAGIAPQYRAEYAQRAAEIVRAHLVAEE